MRKFPEIAILLATYNGEKYIEEQLDSLLNQNYSCRAAGEGLKTQTEKALLTKFENTDTGEGSSNILDFVIYIHDDGSNDNTVSIIQKYADKYPDKITIIEGPPTGGSKNNFFYLINEVSRIAGVTKEAETIDGTSNAGPKYFFFCDQDDVWLKDKIETELTVIKRVEKKDEDEETLPALVWCDMKVVNESLKEISSSFSSYSHLEPDDLDLDRCIMHGKAAGCSMVCNAQLIKMCCEITDNSKIIMHDWVIFLIARMVGRIRYIKTPLALYRQHSHNSIGAQKDGKIQTFTSIVTRVITLKQLKTTQKNLKRYIAQLASLKQVKEVYELHWQLINGADTFENMSPAEKVNFINKFKLYRHRSSKIWTYIAAFFLR